MAEHTTILHTTVGKAAQSLAWLPAQLTLDRLVLICLQFVACRVLATEPCVKFAPAAMKTACANHTDMSTTPEMGRASLLLNSCSADVSSPSAPPLDSGPALLPVREAH